MKNLFFFIKSLLAVFMSRRQNIYGQPHHAGTMLFRVPTPTLTAPGPFLPSFFLCVVLLRPNGLFCPRMSCFFVRIWNFDKNAEGCRLGAEHGESRLDNYRGRTKAAPSPQNFAELNAKGVWGGGNANSL
jgi:hypothetical protein